MVIRKEENEMNKKVYIWNEGEDEYKVLHIQHIKMEEEDVEDEITRLWLVWIFIYFYFFS